MAYETGTANSPGDLLVKLFDFASANGWTVDEDITSDTQIPPQGAIHRDNIYVSFYFFSDYLKLYPARGYTAMNDPGEHPESRHNDTLTSQSGAIGVNEIAGPYTAYHFFESDTYIHVVIVLPNNRYRHFGFGKAIEFGDWQHGEYFYGHFVNQSSFIINQPLAGNHNRPFDSIGGTNRARMAIYMAKNDNTEMPGAPNTNTRWYDVFNQNAGGQIDADGRAVGEAQIYTGVAGSTAMPILALGPSNYNGFIPMIPIIFGNTDRTPTPDTRYLLGNFPDVRVVNVQGLSAGVEHVVGSDTWIIFPVTSDVGGPGIGTEEWSGNQGLAYKKVTT